MTIQELREARAKAVKEARSIHDKMQAEEGGKATAEQREAWDKAMDHAAELKDQYTRAEALESAENEMSASQGRVADLEREDRAGGDAGENGQVETRTVELRPSLDGCSRHVTYQRTEAVIAQETAFRHYLAGGQMALTTEDVRALQQDDDVGGGYLAPAGWMGTLIQRVDDLTFMRQISNVLPPLTVGASLGVPSLDSDPDDAEWTSEIGEAEEDTAMAFGSREFKPAPLAKLIKVSATLLRQSAMSPESIILNRMAYKFGITEEKAFLTGHGAQQPLGVFTASDNGIPTSRDVSDGNDATEIQFDGLKNAKYALKGPYRGRAQWIFHRDAVRDLSKLKDGEGRYMWSASLVAGEPDRLLNMPLNESEYAPNTFTSGKYVGILGDFSQYWIVDSLAMMIQRLNELYARTNQVGFIGRLETDGMPVLGEAFARVKLP